MNTEKFKALLSAKVDSHARWVEIHQEARADPTDTYFDYGMPPHLHYAGMDYIGHPHSSAEHTWWLKREAYRQALGIYPERTEVLGNLVASFHLEQFCIHISKDDPAMVAYTASADDGQRDKQVRLSFGKLMRKLLLLVTDTHLQALEASHRSELDPTFLVARTQEEIARVYTQMAGDSGCMRYTGDHFGLTGDAHPSWAYSYAGLGVAYTEVNGVIKSRSVIYDNPDDPADKRYVRLYGDRALKRKLERAGYRCDNLQGARLKAIRLRDVHRDRDRWTERQYLVPYLDGAGGDQGQYDGSYGYIVQGEDCIRLANKKQATRLAGLGYAAPRLKSTDPFHNVPTVDPAKLNFTCWLTKAECNGLEVESIQILVDGHLHLANKACIGEGTFVQDFIAITFVGGSQQYVYGKGKKEDGCFYETYNYGEWVVDTPDNRRAMGMVLLSEAHGYGANAWEYRHNCVEATPGSGVWVKEGDTMVVFDEHGNETRVLLAAYEELRKSKDYKALAPKGAIKALSHISNPRMVVTVGNRRCIKDWHDIVECCDGTWDYKVNVTSTRLLGKQVFYSSKRVPRSVDIRASEKWVAEMYSIYPTHCRTYDPGNLASALKQHTTGLLRYGHQGRCFFVTGDALMRGTGDSSCSLEAMRAAVNKLSMMDDQAIADTLDETYVPAARGFQYHAALLLKLYDAQIAAWEGAAAAPAPAPAEGEDLPSLRRATARHVTFAA
jgi:hypothetical protein